MPKFVVQISEFEIQKSELLISTEMKRSHLGHHPDQSKHRLHGINTE